MGSKRFLLWTAVSCAVGVGLSTWLAEGSSNGVRAVAALIGLGIGLLVVFLAAWAMPASAPLPAAVTPIEPEPVALAPAPPIEPELSALLDDGRRLDPEPGAVDAWIHAVKRSLAQHRPGAAGYFEALGRKTFDDERARLDAHLARLENILRG